MEPEKPLRNMREKREEDSLGAVLGLDRFPAFQLWGIGSGGLRPTVYVPQIP